MKFFDLLISLLSWLPFTYGNLLHKICTYIFEKLIKYRKKVIFDNINRCFPHFSPKQTKNLAHQYYQHLIAYLLETMQVYKKKASYFEDKIVFANPQILEINDQNPGAVILIGSHYGNWEWSSVLLPLHIQSKVFAIYKPLSNKILDTLIKKLRGRFGLELVAMREVLRKISKPENQGVYIMVSDQSPALENGGKWLNFLGQPTLFYEGAESLSKKFKLRVVYQHISVENGKYTITYFPMKENITDNFVNSLETQIKSHPGPWLWSHRRWKHKKGE